MRIEGTTALVTGAASGIGKRFCEALLAAGAARVIALDHHAPGLRALADALHTRHAPARLRTMAVDVSQERAVAAAMAELVDADAVPDLLVNNAGVLRDGRLATLDAHRYARKLPTAQWGSVLGINLTGPFLLAREFVAARLEAGATSDGLIVNISSVSSAGNAGQSNYAAAKAGLDALTRTWALELAEHRVRVAGLAPGLTDTPMAATLDAATRARLIDEMPLKRMVSTDEIWLGLRFIIECDAYVGRTLAIDGGAAFG
ncbi:SDR family NAD(P)-dependent oxidoreductase [Burkholderia sp. BCC0405]|uniref:SDR family NAD(P)-dependent oxidoreductase n=1 Tax=Burkholderia sp. BCC0405 TaxID=2676298 RepID=UPI00158AC8DC|nr:SDR family NAD(P)-dependent oxidoreductase [Burkholderia sp. BCC0405]